MTRAKKKRKIVSEKLMRFIIARTNPLHRLEKKRPETRFQCGETAHSRDPIRDSSEQLIRVARAGKPQVPRSRNSVPGKCLSQDTLYTPPGKSSTKLTCMAAQ